MRKEGSIEERRALVLDENGSGLPLFVSVVVRTKDCEAVIERCMRSLVNVDYPRDRYEIIVVDGHSRDRTVAIAQRYGARVFYDDGRGRNHALNEGMRYVRGTYVAFTDADCAVDKNWLKNSLPYFVDEHVAAVGGPNPAARDAKALVRALAFVNGFFVYRPRGQAFVDYLATCNCIYRTGVAKEFFPLPEIGGGEDAVLGCRARKADFKLLFAPNVIVWDYTNYDRPGAFLRHAVALGKHRVQLVRFDHCFGSPQMWLRGFSLPMLATLVSVLYLVDPRILLGAIALGVAVSLIVLGQCWLRTKSLATVLHVPVVAVLLAAGYSIGFIGEAIRPTGRILKNLWKLGSRGP
jgi:GT2 family glycosyltransferase